jgi:hypothetical protein
LSQSAFAFDDGAHEQDDVLAMAAAIGMKRE